MYIIHFYQFYVNLKLCMVSFRQQFFLNLFEEKFAFTQTLALFYIKLLFILKHDKLKK